MTGCNNCICSYVAAASLVFWSSRHDWSSDRTSYFWSYHTSIPAKTPFDRVYRLSQINIGIWSSLGMSVGVQKFLTSEAFPLLPLLSFAISCFSWPRRQKNCKQRKHWSIDLYRCISNPNYFVADCVLCSGLLSIWSFNSLDWNPKSLVSGMLLHVLLTQVPSMGLACSEKNKIKIQKHSDIFDIYEKNRIKEEHILHELLHPLCLGQNQLDIIHFCWQILEWKRKLALDLKKRKK